MYIIELTGQIARFMVEILPYLTFLTLLTITIFMAIKERQRRKLSLNPAPAAKIIERMLEKEQLSTTDAEKLKSKLNSLPEVTEAHPLPDIHLRLASALTKTYSLLKIFWAFNIIAIVSLFWLSYKLADMQIQLNYTLPHDKSWITLVWLIISIIAIIEFIAARNLTHGNPRSRKIIISIWLVDLTFIYGLTWNTTGIIYTIITVGIALYILWCLYLRYHAERFIIFNASPCSKHFKNSLLVMFFTAIACGIFFNNSKLSLKQITTYKQTKTANIYNSSRSRTGHLGISTLNRIAIIEAQLDQDTATVTNQVFTTLQKQFPMLKFQYLKYGKSFPAGTIKFDQYIFIHKTELIHKSQIKSKLPMAIREILPPLLNGKMDKYTIYFQVNINPISQWNPDVNLINKTSMLHFFTSSSLSGSMLVSSDTNNCSRKSALNEISRDIVKNLTKTYNVELNSFQQAKIPAFLTKKLTKNLVKQYKFLKNSWLVGEFSNVRFNNFSLWVMPLENIQQKQEQAIVKELTQADWQYARKERGKYIEYEFTNAEKDKNITIRLPQISIHKSAVNYAIAKAKTNFAFVSYRAANKQIFSKAEAEKFRHSDLRSYICYANFAGLDKADFFAIYERILSIPNISYGALKILHQYCNIKKFQPEGKRIRQQLLIKMGEVLNTDNDKIISTANVRDFIKILKKDSTLPFVQHQAFAPLKKNIFSVKMNKIGNNNYSSMELITAARQLMIINVDLPQKNKQQIFIIKFTPMNNGNNKLNISTDSTNNLFSILFSREQKGDILNFLITCDQKNGVGSSRNFNNKIFIPNGISLLFNYIAKDNQFKYQLFSKKKRTKLACPR